MHETAKFTDWEPEESITHKVVQTTQDQGLLPIGEITHGLVEIQHDLKPQSRNHRRYHQFSYHCPNAKT